MMDPEVKQQLEENVKGLLKHQEEISQKKLETAQLKIVTLSDKCEHYDRILKEVVEAMKSQDLPKSAETLNTIRVKMLNW